MTVRSLVNLARGRLSGLADWMFPARRRRRKRENWEHGWSRPDFQPPWLGRETSPEIVTAVDEGWFPAGVPVLDIGCGQGEIVGWFSERGFQAVGLDIAAAAIARARTLYPEIPGRREFHVMDICEQPPPNYRYGIIVDRGCFHQIPAADWPGYLRNLLQVAAPQARMILLHKAFREGQKMGDPAERRRVTKNIERGLGSAFTVVRSAETYLDPFNGAKPGLELPGLVYWLERSC